MDTNKIVISGKSKHSNNDFNFFNGYKDHNIVRSNEWIHKTYLKRRKIMFSVIKDDSVLMKYKKIWNNIKNTLNTKFYGKPTYGEKYLKAKVRYASHLYRLYRHSFCHENGNSYSKFI